MREQKGKQQPKSGLKVMAGLINMIRPLIGYMAFAVCLGSLGHLCAIFITVLGGYGILQILGFAGAGSMKTIILPLILAAVFRGILRYGEQASNHFIAFKLLARIRHQVFAVLRKLAPAKLEGREKGDLISILTTDIELLEVFYAHTISPIAIALVTSVVMIVYIVRKSWVLAWIACLGYVVVGVIIPILNGKAGRKNGQEYRRKYGQLNGVVLDNLQGIKEILQYGQGADRKILMESKTGDMEKVQRNLKRLEGGQRAVTDGVILLISAAAVTTLGILVMSGQLEFSAGVLAVLAIMSSFGPTAALGSLSNNLMQTLASGNRVLELLEEEPLVAEIGSGKDFVNGDINADKVAFSYGEEEVLKDLDFHIKQGSITGIMGDSGSGKSTLLKLLMRFFPVKEGIISYHRQPVENINTRTLRRHIAYVTQETFLFQGTIEENIKTGNEDASRAEVIEAAKKASVHEFIESLPAGYDTLLHELGDSLSGGERQRIGIARAFLYKADVILLDEPTSNLDSLNEGVILKSLKESREKETIVLVSHRNSTTRVADEIITL